MSRDQDSDEGKTDDKPADEHPSTQELYAMIEATKGLFGEFGFEVAEISIVKEKGATTHLTYSIKPQEESTTP